MIKFALFRDRFSWSISRQVMPWRRFTYEVMHDAPSFKDKHSCPLISLTEYGEKVSMSGSYRHIENAIATYGIEGDYDAGEISARAAYLRLLELRLRALVVTTPSHTPDAPRWRVLMPLARPCPVEDRRGIVERLNGALDGVLAPESGTATQCFYIGKTIASEEHFEAYESFGRCIDEAREIPPVPMAVSQRAREDAPSNAEWNKLSREEQYDYIRLAFESKDGRHEAARRLAVMMAQDGANVEDIRGQLRELLGNDTRGGERGQRNLARDIMTLPEWAVRKIGAPKADSMRRVNASLPGLIQSLHRKTARR